MAEDYIDGKGFVVILEKAVNSCLIMLLYFIFSQLSVIRDPLQNSLNVTLVGEVSTQLYL